MPTRVLYTTPELAVPPASGPTLRVLNSIKTLARVTELHLLSQVRPQALGNAGIELLSSICRGFGFTPGDQSHPRENAQAIAEYCAQHEISIVWLGYGNISFPLMNELRTLAPNLRLICDTDSVWSRFVLRGIPFASSEQRRAEIQAEGVAKEREERQMVAVADITTAVSEVDAEYYRELTKDPRKIKLFSNVIDLDDYREMPARAPGLPSQYLYLSGSFYAADAPMTEAAQWLMSEIWPKVVSQIPDLGLVILGRGADQYIQAAHDPRIIVRGYVDSTLPYLRYATAALVPLRFESGTRFKILEASACGIPVVSTTLGAEGLGARHGQDLLIADSPEDFANACIRICRSPSLGAELSNAARTVVSRRFSLDSLAIEAQEILSALDGEKTFAPPNAAPPSARNAQVISMLSLQESRRNSQTCVSVAVPQELHGSQQHELFLYGLRGHKVVGPYAAIFSPEGALIAESTIGVEAARAVDTLSPADLRVTPEHIPGRVAPAHGFWAEGFWHWMLEWLPRAYLFEELGLAPTYVIPPSRPFISESLQLLGVPLSRIRMANGTSYTADEILTMTPVTGGALDHFPALLLGLRAKLLASVGPPRKTGRRIYLRRTNPHRPRRVVNESDTESLLRSFDFEPVDFDALPLRSQIALAHEASTIVGPHGAGMVHSLFLPTESMVVELMAPTYINPCVLSVCRVLRHRYSIIPSCLWEGEYKYGQDIETFLWLLRVTLERELGNDQFAELRRTFSPELRHA